MRILIIGSGGREHAIGASIAKSSNCSALFFAPGNAGTSEIGENLNVDPFDFAAVIDEIRAHKIDWVLIGPEAPLEAGLADVLRENNIPVIGPGKAGAIMEASKDWSKRFMDRHSIPTAKYRSFQSSEVEEAVKYLQSHPLPIVVKASGLAAGKGVLICENREEAEQGLREMLSGSAFGQAGETVVIEEFLSGIELSVFALTDGESYVLLPEAKDYKRIGEGDTGLNTGGMGAVSPVPIATADFMEKVKTQIVEPTINGLRQEGIPYIGFIFFGLISVNDSPFVIEYNARMGDPETEVVFPRIKSDLVDLLFAAANSDLKGKTIEFVEAAAATVMLVSGGYPGKYENGKAISCLDEIEGSQVFHAGTSIKDSELVTAGGRVLALTSFAENIQAAVKNSLKNAEKVNFEGKYFRRDIGWEFF